NGYYTQNDGFTTRVDSSSNRDIDRSIASTEHYGARLSSLFRVIDGTEFELNFDAFQQNDGTNLMTPIVPDDPTSLAQLLSKNGSSNFQPLFGARRGALEPLTARGGFQGRFGSNYDGFGIVFKASIESGIGTFKSITGYRTYDGHYLTQLSSTDSRSTIFGVTIGSTVETDEDYKQFSQEFQLTGTIQDKFNYTAGLYYFNNQWSQLQYGSTIGVPVEFSPVSQPGFTERFGGSFQDTHLDSKSYAIYLDAAWEFVENVSLIGGVRQTWDKKRVDYDSLFEDNITRYPGFPVNPSRDYSRFTPRVGLNWQATPDVLLFGTYAEGYKAGNLEGDRATSPGPASNFLDPETVKTFEVGIKAEWFDRTLRTNIAAFSSKFTNHADLISPETVALSDQKVNGLEFEVTWVPIRSLQIYANLGLLDSKYTRADASHPIFAPDFSGFAPGLDAEPVVTPDYNFSMGIYYEHDLASAGKLAFNGSFEGVGSQFNGLGVANLDSERVKAYTVAAASVTYRTANNRFSVTAGVNNLFDATYWTTGFFGSVPEFAGRAYADGRTGYVRMGFSF
ncbi:MAG: TonB-dependent receptor domain-containing protein, partial [Sandaracinobacteroides sp.]